MVDETFEGEESFAELFEKSLEHKPRRVQPGEKVTGTVVHVGRERVIVDLGGGIDGTMELSELAPDRHTAADVKEGDRVEAYVTRVENRVAVLARSLGKGPGARLALQESQRTGVPVEGTVAEVNKGGYVVEVAGARCFCPLGQMDLRRIEDPTTMVGRKLQFLVQEMRGERDVVVSRRALLEREQAEVREKTRRYLEPGARFRGTVTSVRDFGAFVDIGGLDGLVPVSELGYGRARPQDVVHVGQEVDVEVLRIEPPGPKDRTERITLSMRALAADPWDEVTRELGEGVIVRGKVARLQPFGAFVEIVPGVDGLLHVSAFGRRVAHPADVVQVGEEVAVRIDAIDPSARRISLSYVPPEELAGLIEQTTEPEQPAAEPQPAPEPVKAEAPKAAPPAGGGLTVRRAERPKSETPAPAPAAAPAAEQARPRVLGMAQPGAEAEAAPAPKSAAPQTGQVVDVTVDKIESFGLFVKWGSHRGLLPAAELDVPKGADLRKSHPVGTQLKAAIIEVRPDGRIRLSANAVQQAEERAEAQAWMSEQKKGGASGSSRGLGTLGDLLKGKLGK